MFSSLKIARLIVYTFFFEFKGNKFCAFKRTLFVVLFNIFIDTFTGQTGAITLKLNAVKWTAAIERRCWTSLCLAGLMVWQLVSRLVSYEKKLFLKFFRILS